MNRYVSNVSYRDDVVMIKDLGFFVYDVVCDVCDVCVVVYDVVFVVVYRESMWKREIRIVKPVL